MYSEEKLSLGVISVVMTRVSDSTRVDSSQVLLVIRLDSSHKPQKTQLDSDSSHLLTDLTCDSKENSNESATHRNAVVQTTYVMVLWSTVR